MSVEQVEILEGIKEKIQSVKDRMREQMEERVGGQVTEWLKGIDDLSPGSFDLLTVTVLWPE